MRPILKTTVVAAILATGSLLAAPREAKAQQLPLAYYYSSPGYYATTEGTVSIPAAGYYYNVPAHVVLTPRFVSTPTWGQAPYRIPLRGRGGIRFISEPTPPAMFSPVPSYRPTDPW